jgi:LexA-binding, inner membrane-associated putative hydrolase
MSWRTVVVCLAVIAGADLLIWRWRAPYAIEALLDGPAHAATGLLGLMALGVGFGAPLVLAVLAGSLLIDADHLPHVFGSDILEHGVPRPYTHSLGTIVILLVVAVLVRDRGRRRLILIATLALALHFFRDMAEPGGPGVSLLWPLSDHAVKVAYGWYAALLLMLAAIAIGRRMDRRPREPDAMLHP